MDREEVAGRREKILDDLYRVATGIGRGSAPTNSERIAAAAAYLSHTWAIVDPPGGRPPGAGRRVLQRAGAPPTPGRPPGRPSTPVRRGAG